MQEYMGILDDGGTAIDVATHGGIVASINGISGWLIEMIKKFGWEEKLGQLFPGIPFFVAFVIGYLVEQNLEVAMSKAMTYGMAAIAAHSINRVTFQKK